MSSHLMRLLMESNLTLCVKVFFPKKLSSKYELLLLLFFSFRVPANGTRLFEKMLFSITY